jgi:glutamate carboxypeptidase
MGKLVSEEIYSRTLDLLLELCRISSASGDVDGLRKVAGRCGRELSRHGLAVELLEERDADGEALPILVARGAATAEGHILVVGHMDTVLPAIEPHVEGDMLWGTGALDMKGGLATFIGALDVLAERGSSPPADLMLVGVPDEEVGGQISEEVVRRWGASARALLVIEPGERRGDTETLVAGRRGLTEWSCQATGRASHSGLAYWEGRSAAAALAEFAWRAQCLSERGPGVTVNVARLLAGDADFVDGLTANHVLYGTSKRRNVISERAGAEGEVRYLSPADRDRVLLALAELAREVGARHEVDLRFDLGAAVPPVDPNGPGRSLVERTVSLARARGWRLEVEDDRGGISFPNYVADPTKVPIVDGLGPVGDGMHTREEHLHLPSLERRIALLADLLATL